MPETGLPYALVTQFTVNPAAGEAFDALVAQTAAAARANQPGVLVYACHLVDGEPSARIIYEMYTGRAALDAWQASAPARSFAAGVRSLAAASAVTFLEPEGTSTPISHLEAVTRGAHYALRQSQERARIIGALLTALRQLSTVMALIEASESAAAAGPALMQLLGFSDEIEARVVLDVQLRKLAGHERQQLTAEYEQLTAEIAEYESILSSPGRVAEVAPTERGDHLARLGRDQHS